MSIAIQLIGDEYAPVVTCDWCGERIEDAKSGNYHWNPHEEPLGTIYFTHKRCCYAFDQEQKPNGITFADQLENFTWFLRHNLKQKTPGGPPLTTREVTLDEIPESQRVGAVTPVIRYQASGLKQALTDRGSSVSWLSRKIGVTRQLVDRIVQGHQTTDESRAQAIAEAMNLPIESLFEPA